MSPLLEAGRVSYLAGGKHLVREATLAAAPGRSTVIVGPNGAGKSTLMRLLSGEKVPSGGEVTYSGEAVRAIPSWRLACLRAVLPQASRLAFPFAVADIVRIGVDGIGRGLGKRERAAIVERALHLADVAHLASRSYQSLSGGEQQRSQFARVLAQLEAGRSVAPVQALLLDEPVASLDLKHQLALMEAAAALARAGVAVVAVLHDLNLAAAYADSLVVMSGGEIVAEGPPSRVLDDALVASVFEVGLKVGARPPDGQPFLIPFRKMTPMLPLPAR